MLLPQKDRPAYYKPNLVEIVLSSTKHTKNYCHSPSVQTTMPSQSNNKRIAKNAVALYFRMFLTMLVGLYTSRIVLQTLGVEDYGVYNIVGGVVGLLGFLNATMSGATSRFLTFELGRGDFNRLNLTFNSALLVHIGIAVIVFVVAETLGLWYLINRIVIPEGRMTAAIWVYEFSVLSAMISITQVPYNASIISHENMRVYAFVEIIFVLLKLGIVFLLWLTDEYDKLILYGALVLLVHLIVAMIYRIYSIKQYEECHFQIQFDRQIIKEIVSFSGFNLFANFGVVVNRQGTNIIINRFFGVVFNAASGLATTVADSISNFAHNIITAFRPAITKSYARNDIVEQEKLTKLALTISMYMMLLISIPAMIEINYIIRLWLGIIPEGMEMFVRLILIANLFEIIKYIFVINVHATGKVKDASIATGLILSSNPILVYIVYKVFPVVSMAYVCLVGAQVSLALVIAFITKKKIPEFHIGKLLLGIGKVLAVAIISYLITYFSIKTMDQSIMRVIVAVLISSIVFSSLTYVFCLDKGQKQYVVTTIKHKLSSITNGKRSKGNNN